MNTFMDKDFILTTKTARKLFHNYAEKMPILDYHCHINPEEIARDRHFENITQVWLGGDHYKWRFMRSCGVEEKYITGDASDHDKFIAWAKCLGRALSFRDTSATTVPLMRKLPRKYGTSAIRSLQAPTCRSATSLRSPVLP